MNGPTALCSGWSPSPEKPRLLLAEDEPSLRTFLCELLQEEYTVEAITNGEQAWAAVQRQLPDLILSDVQMPLLDGLGLIRRLRADARTASVPLIIMTANNQKDTLFEALEAGMDDFLLKPFHPLELLARLSCQRRMIALRREATEKIARQEAVVVEQAKNRFLACLSHELRNPLAPVPFALHLIDQTEGLPAFVYEAVGVVRRGTETETRLINDLLDVSQIVHGKLSLNVEPIDLHDCLGQAIKDCREDYGPKGLKLKMELTAEMHQVSGDFARLQQVFCHLLQNAGKFTPANGTISVRSANDGEDIVVEVQDSGVGIAAEDLSKIFVPFEHGCTEKERVYGGLGLGLTIAHAIITAHDGQLTVESPGTGQGATFRVCLNTRSSPGLLRAHGTTSHRKVGLSLG